MLFIFSTPELIRNLWQLKTAVFLHWRLICSVPFQNLRVTKVNLLNPNKKTIYDVNKVKTFRPVTPIAVLRPRTVYHNPNVFPGANVIKLFTTVIYDFL
jgi:hypothetical protein